MTALRFEVEGEPEPTTLEPTLHLLMHPDGRKRRAAAEALAKVFKDNVRLFTLITNTLAKDKEISDRWRGFKDVADSRHLANRVEREVVEALVSAVREAYPRTAHRYYAMKARWLGKDKLAYWDRNAPLPDKPERIIPWSDAQEIVLDAYGGFAPEMAVIARRFFDGRWIDAPVREGKSPGAFSHPTVPSAHPYILMNYQGRLRDVMTLAHELGHGVHQVLAAPQGPLLAPTPLTLAETASVFGEMLTFKSLIGPTDPKEKKAMLAQKVEDMINTVVRQIAFYSFERKVHEERQAGELTSERLGQIWLRGAGREPGSGDRAAAGLRDLLELRPPLHPFAVLRLRLCVRRLPGELAVRALPGRPPRVRDEYFAMLEAGGSKHHSELLAPFGLDACRARLLEEGLRGHRGHDRRARGHGSTASLRRSSKRRSRTRAEDHRVTLRRGRLGWTDHASTNFPGGPFAAAKRWVYKPRPSLRRDARNSRKPAPMAHAAAALTAPRTGKATSAFGPWRSAPSVSSTATSAPVPSTPSARL